MPVEIKIECSCGTRYAFEVEPVNGQMPGAVPCPNCGVDGTAAANEFLRHYFATRPAATPIVVATPARAVAHPVAPAPGPAKKRREYGQPNMSLGTLGAVAGGFVGMMIWFLIIKWTNVEAGIVAWGVGGLVGFGCRVLGGGYSQKLGFIAAGCAFVAIIGGEYLATKAVFDEFADKMVQGLYEQRLGYAKEAIPQKTDDDIRQFLKSRRAGNDDAAAPGAEITAQDIEKFRKRLPELKDFANGKPSQAEFVRTVRGRLDTAELKALVLKNSVSLWTLLWLFLGVGSAYRLGVGEVE